ncbi:MAG: amidohydrolase family protein [Alphaproteobacteria bacterium]|nr:amidohydrolase family protein [Alphaproteobacteria bacterium]
MDRPIAFRNARLIDPASGLDKPGGLLTVDGRIAELGPGLFAYAAPPGVETVDCKGWVLAPGLVDMRVFLREPGQEHKETIKTASLSAAAGGVTTMIAMPNTKPPIDDVSLVDFMERRARDTASVRIHPMAAITKGTQGKELTEMGLLTEAGAVGFTDGEVALADARLMRRAMSYARTFDFLISNHVEEPALAAGGAMNSGAVSTRLGLSGIPAAAEVIMLERDLRLAELTGCRYHAASISTAESVAVLRRGRERGLKISAAVAPYHFTLTEDAIGEYRTFCKVSPPLRTQVDIDAILAGLADGTIEIIASCHAPQDQEGKRQTFAQARIGMVGLETLLALTLAPVHDGKLDLVTVLRAMTCNPARLLGLDRGRLRKGAPADLCLFDPGLAWRIDPERFRSKSKNSPFEDHPVKGKVMLTVVGGKIVYDERPNEA